MKMRCLNALTNGLTAVAFLSSLSFAAPNPDPGPAGACRPTYNITKYRLDFEDIFVPCFFRGPCPPMTRLNISTPRGQGLAYTKPGEMEKPLLIPNLGAWQVINCTWEGFADKDERYACANNSVRALYSPGKSPFDGSRPRINTLDFPETYGFGALDSLYFTPIRLPTNTKKAAVQLVGIKPNGQKVKHNVQLDISSGKKQFLISSLKKAGFTNIRVLELWLVVHGKGGYEFAIDDLNLEEYRPLPRPAYCTPPTPTITVDRGPCTIRPSKTTTWTANAEDFTTYTSVPTPYASLTWNTYTSVMNSSTLFSWFWPGNLTTRGNFYQAYSPFQLLAYTREQRFGVESLSFMCGFAQWQDPDYSGTNDSPCTVTFIGRRDPYDGDGLPSIVAVNYTIPNPGRYATTQKFTTINLNSLTNSPGKFSNLYAFAIHARIGTIYPYDTSILLDNLVLNRRTRKDDINCHMPGGKLLHFDDIKIGSTLQQMPPIYKGFKFSDEWGVNSKKNYAPGTPGYLGVISPSNALYTGFKPSPHYSNVIDSYVDPAMEFLFDFEEATITLDLPEYAKNVTILQDIRVSISIKDACGMSTTYVTPTMLDPPIGWYYRTLTPDKLTFTYAEPLRGISSFSIYAFVAYGDYRQVELFIDDFRYRKYKGPTPGCFRCGYRGADFCEIPAILPR